MKQTPKYMTVYHKLKEDILSGKYPVGSLLPTEEELEKIYQVSRTTIRNASALLQNEKMIKVCQGRGTQILPTEKMESDFSFPAAGSPPTTSVSNQFMLPDGYTTSAQGAVIDRLPADPRVSEALNISLGEEVYRLQRLKYVNGNAFCYTVSYIPCTLTPGMEQYNNEITFLYQFLQDTYGIKRTRTRIHISAVSAGFLESKLLNVAVGVPLLLNLRCSYCEDVVFEYNENFFRTDYMQMVVEFSNDGAPLQEDE